MIRIRNFARGARGVRVLWQCEEMALPYEFASVTYPPGDDYLALNPLGSVPFLEDAGGVAINESIAMMLYLAHKYGPTPLLPGKDDPALARVLQLTILGEATLGMGMNPLLEAKFSAPDEDKRNWTVRTQEGRVERAIAYVADLLGSSPFLVGDQLTLADISVGTVIGMWRGALGQTLPDTLLAYKDRLSARPAFQRAVASCTA